MKNHNKDNDKSRVRELATENRDLKKIVGKLRKRVEELEAMIGNFSDLPDEADLETKKQKHEEKKAENKCPECEDGKIVYIELPGNRRLKTCKNCGYRDSIKKKEEKK